MATLIRGLKFLVSKDKRSRRPLPGDRSEYEIRKEVEQDLQKWRDKAIWYLP